MDAYEYQSASYIDLVTKCLSVALLVAITYLLWKMLSERTSSHQSRPPGNTKTIPGPSGLPIIGNAHKLGPDPHKYFLDLAEQYGDVFQIKLGRHKVVVLNKSKAIQQALVTQTIEFAGRPAFPGFLAVLSVRGGGIGFHSYDEGWKVQRDMINKAFRDFSHGSQVGIVESQVTAEANELIKFVLKGKESNSFEPKPILRIALVNTMTNLLFGVRRGLDHPDLQELIDANFRSLEASANGNVVNFLPGLKGILGSKMRNIESTSRHSKDLVDVYVDESWQNYQKDSKQSILHNLISISKDIDIEKRETLKLTNQMTKAAVYDLFGAGYETVSTTLMWTFLYLVKFPDIQRQVQDEIDNVVGRDRLPTLADRDKLPLTEAFIAEVFRHVSVVPLVVPHTTTQDTILGGGYEYCIPKDTIVFMSLYSIHKDPNQWVDPETFNPTRFLAEDGPGLDKKKVDSVMPLGAGCRRCVGVNIAPIQLFLYTSICLHQCSFKSSRGQPLSLDGITTPITVQPQNYAIKMERR